MGKNFGKNISKKLCGKYSPSVFAMCQKLLDHAKSATDSFKTSSKRVIEKTAEPTGDLFGNKTADKSQKFQKIYNKIIQKQLQKNGDKEIPKERYVSPGERQEIIDELRLK